MAKHKKYCVVYDSCNTIDGIKFNTLEEALNKAVDILVEWEAQEIANWNWNPDHSPCLTEEQIEAWDTLINESSVYVVEWDKEKQDYKDAEHAIYLGKEKLKNLNWMDWESLKAKWNW